MNVFGEEVDLIMYSIYRDHCFKVFTKIFKFGKKKIFTHD
jgi:hypothetical protein